MKPHTKGWQPLLDSLDQFSEDFMTSRDRPDEVDGRVPFPPNPIESEAEYEAALAEIERLWDAAPGTPESDTFDMLVTLVEACEKGRYDLPPPDPLAALEYFLESRGLKRT
jgi:hypothetical protein